MAKSQNIGCYMCGRVPTRSITIRRHVGMVFVGKFIRLDKSLCRDHGVQVTKSFLGKTMYQGWWGIISVFANAFNVVWDLGVLVAFKRMPAPPPVTQPVMRRFDGSALPVPF